MSNNRREVEARGQDVEAAIEAGLKTLGVGRGDVIVEIVDEGSRGLLGIGSREAVVRLTKIGGAPAAETERETHRPEPRRVEPARVAAAKPVRQDTASDGDEVSAEAVGETAVQVVQDLLSKMEVSAEVSASLTEPDDLTGRRIFVVDIEGDDLGMLIGPRGETLNSLQYVSRLMVGHQLKDRVDFVLDVQGYRQRREQALTRLAVRMAKKVSTRQRAMSLEPMPPHERRIIHMALREDNEVYTQSSGDGRRRRVRIIPKE